MGPGLKIGSMNARSIFSQSTAARSTRAKSIHAHARHDAARRNSKVVYDLRAGKQSRIAPGDYEITRSAVRSEASNSLK